MTKPSEVQLRVMKAMANGWELACGLGFESSAWLQKGEAGKDGETDRISRRTVAALSSFGWIEPGTRHFPMMTYKLTEAGAIWAQQGDY